MTTRSTLLNLGRVGAATAAAIALVGLAACVKPAAPANNTAATNTAAAGAAATESTATNGAGLGATTVPGAPVAPVNGMAAAPGGDMAGPMNPGGITTPGAAPGAPAPGAGASGVGGSTAMVGPQGGDQSGGPQAAGGGDQNANDDYDKNFINSCFHTAVKNGNSVDSAANYCTCAMGELDQLSLPQKQSLTGSSPQVVQAERDCQAGSN